ncbi:glycyl-radical enzyme activating protein [Enterococcus sp. CSURQ0835]|uniref:glycyl-radical enzyme activating protein n=1 Tax=Enterococcus sp. CSURQ0835 TaxID=2681394 RepID=UPI0013594D0F|nr:glycyl-radical enzyme activating protein [Enterococcus sp. CSURQ0835]
MTKTACIFNLQKFSLHDGPGIRTVVFFKGCPLRCAWCANPESQHAYPEAMWDRQKERIVPIGEEKTIAEIMTVVLQDQAFYRESGGGVTLSGGEVLFQADFAIQLLKALKYHQIHTACETTGFCRAPLFREFLAYVDLLYFDVKHYDPAAHQVGTGVKNELILTNLQQALNSSVETIVRIPVIPTFNDRLADAQQFAQLLHTLGAKKVELLPFHQFGEEKYVSLNRDYAYHDYPQLHSEESSEYQKIFQAQQLDCVVR